MKVSFLLCDRCGAILSDNYTKLQMELVLGDDVSAGEIMTLCDRCSYAFRSEFLPARARVVKADSPQERACYIAAQKWIEPQGGADESS